MHVAVGREGKRGGFPSSLVFHPEEEARAREGRVRCPGSHSGYDRADRADNCDSTSDLRVRMACMGRAPGSWKKLVHLPCGPRMPWAGEGRTVAWIWTGENRPG